MLFSLLVLVFVSVLISVWSPVRENIIVFVNYRCEYLSPGLPLGNPIGEYKNEFRYTFIGYAV